MQSRKLIVLGSIILFFGLTLISPVAEFILKVIGYLFMILGVMGIGRGILSFFRSKGF